MLVQTIAERGANETAFGLLADDPYDRALIENVHPSDWENPRPRGSYHLVVVGGGTAGLVTAAIAAALGARVALVERRLLGGDCLNVGCVPSKAVIRASRAWWAAREAAARFGGPVAGGDGDFASAMERMRRIRSAISGHDSAARFRDLGVDVFLGDGTFSGPRSFTVAGETLRFRRAVIATGSRASVPPIPGLPETNYLTNENLFSLTEQPRRLAVIGGGSIGCEIAQAFARFGTRVVLIEAADRILSADDADAAKIVAARMEHSGIEIVRGAKVSRVQRSGPDTLVQYETADGEDEFIADRLLVATGRSPNVEGLGLEEAGVRFDARSGVETDDRMQTSNRRIFAIGDVASRYHFTHAADAQARIVVRNALFYGRGKASQLVIPWCTYTSPELAHVGITAGEAKERGTAVDSITIPFADVDRARLDGDTEGFLRIHLKTGSDEILGATIVDEHAGELISQITQAMTAGIGLAKLGETIFPYPTRAEIIRKAADSWRRRKLTPAARRGFALFFRLLG
jgi:pyruvate/2-oxoglutarate dehydrogenase complex dihydrolipoamide dehydrogenase (E3) component